MSTASLSSSSLIKALFYNFVAIDYKIGLIDLLFFAKLILFMRKEHANLGTDLQNGFILR